MIDKRSRYRKTPLVELPRGAEEPLTLLDLRQIPRIQSVFFHIPVASDRLDLLAQQHYRNPTLFYQIADASDQLDPFDVIEIGAPLAIPPQR